MKKGGPGLFFEAIFSQNPARVPYKFCPVPNQIPKIVLSDVVYWGVLCSLSMMIGDFSQDNQIRIEFTRRIYCFGALDYLVNSNKWN